MLFKNSLGRKYSNSSASESPRTSPSQRVSITDRITKKPSNLELNTLKVPSNPKTALVSQSHTSRIYRSSSSPTTALISTKPLRTSRKFSRFSIEDSHKLMYSIILTQRCCLNILRAFTLPNHATCAPILEYIPNIVECFERSRYEEIKSSCLVLFRNLAADCYVCRDRLLVLKVPKQLWY